MDIINHTLNWCKGEIFEARIILIFGFTFLLLSFLFWKYGQTPSAKGFIIPLVLLSLLCIGMGISMNFSNQNRIVKFQKDYSEDAEKFRKDEIKRVQGFMNAYVPVKIVMSVFILAGLFFIFISGSFYWKSIALTLILVGITGISIDHFSEERARNYYNNIAEQVNINN